MGGTNHSAVLTDRNLNPSHSELLPAMRPRRPSLTSPQSPHPAATPSAHDLHLDPSLALGSHRGLLEFFFTVLPQLWNSSVLRHDFTALQTTLPSDLSQGVPVLWTAPGLSSIKALLEPQ